MLSLTAPVISTCLAAIPTEILQPRGVHPPYHNMQFPLYATDCPDFRLIVLEFPALSLPELLGLPQLLHRRY